MKLTKVFGGQVKDINEQEQTLTALVSTGTVDRMGDVVEPKGVDLRNYRNNPVVMWAHDYTTPPIGKAVWIKKSDSGLTAKVKFANTPFAQEIYGLYKEKFLNAFSIGFSAKEKEPIEKNKGDFGPQRFLKTELLEFSAVPVPANPEALQLAIKKGILHDENIKHAIEKEIEEEESEEGQEDVKQVNSGTDVFLGDGLDEVLAENDQLKEHVINLENRNTQLRKEVFELREEKQKRLSEIAVEHLGEKVADMVDRAIRKRMGKID